MAMRHDSSETTLFYANLVGISIMLPVLPFVWTTPPSWLDLTLLLAVGALRRVRALSPDPGPPSGAGLGAVAVHLYAARVGDDPRLPGVRERAERWTLAGAAIVIASGLYLLNRERKVAGPLPRPSPVDKIAPPRLIPANCSEPAQGTVMATKPAANPALNDDIGEETRLELFESQVIIREAEQRAYDLFLQNLVKGTSHLSLGQEAVAAGFAVAMKKGDLTFCTYRGHAHTLARGVPVEKVLGELMQRDNGLMRGKGGSMHLTSDEHGVMGSYAIIGAHLPIACGAAWRAQYKGEDDVTGLLLRRRHHQHRRVPRGAELRGGLEAAGGVRLREQPLHGIHADQRRHRGAEPGRRPRLGLRPREDRDRRQRRRRGLPRGADRLRQGARRQGSVADRVPDLPPQRPLARRPGEVSPRGRARALEGARPDQDLQGAPQAVRHRRRSGRSRSRTT